MSITTSTKNLNGSAMNATAATNAIEITQKRDIFVGQSCRLNSIKSTAKLAKGRAGTSASAFTPVIRREYSVQQSVLTGTQTSLLHIINSKKPNKQSIQDMIRQAGQGIAVQQSISGDSCNGVSTKDSIRLLALKQRSTSLDLTTKESKAASDQLLVNSINALCRLGPSQFTEQQQPLALSQSLSRSASILASKIAQVNSPAIAPNSQYNSLLQGAVHQRPISNGSMLQQLGSVAVKPVGGLVNAQAIEGVNELLRLGVPLSERMEAGHSLTNFFREPLGLQSRFKGLETIQKQLQSPQIVGRGFKSIRNDSVNMRDHVLKETISTDNFMKLNFQVGNPLGDSAFKNSTARLDDKPSLQRAREELKQEIAALCGSPDKRSGKLQQSSILDQHQQHQSTIKQKSVGISIKPESAKAGQVSAQQQLTEQDNELAEASKLSKNKHAVYIPGLGTIDDYMASDDLNECVDALLQKRSKAAFQQQAAALENSKKDRPAKKSATTLPTPAPSQAKQESPKTPPATQDAAPMQSTSDNSPEGSISQLHKANGRTLIAPASASLPRIVIRNRVKGAKKAQKRTRRTIEQNKILLTEFEKCQAWVKPKIMELQQRLGMKPQQIVKWNSVMQRKLCERQGPASQSMSAPDITMDDDTLSDREVYDWSDGYLAQLAGGKKGVEDSLMSDERAQQSQAAVVEAQELPATQTIN